MRINRFVALASGVSRRTADTWLNAGRIKVNGVQPQPGQQVSDSDTVRLDNRPLSLPATTQTIMFNKPEGYVCSRNGQGSKTVYDLLPRKFRALKPVGRLDKNSSGLLLLTNDGTLAHQLTHPSFRKLKIYEVELNKPLQPLHRQMIGDNGIRLEDGLSRLNLERFHEGNDHAWRITMHEGRNRQIRRTFAALGYDVIRLHRTQFGNYLLENLSLGTFKELPN